MKTSRHLSVLLLALGSAVIMVAAAACSGGGSSGGNPSGLTNCQIVWSSPGSVTERYDVYIVDMPIGDWTDGTKDYIVKAGQSHVGVFYDELLVSSNAYAARAITTSGQFSITATQGTNIGEPVTFTDDGNQNYFAINGNQDVLDFVGSGGDGTFDGFWSDPNGTSTNPGTASSLVNITYMGTPETLGTYTRYAICYHQNPNGAASMKSPLETRLDGIESQLKRQPAFQIH